MYDKNKQNITLTIDSNILEQSKKLAKVRGVSLSSLVESLLAPLCIENKKAIQSYEEVVKYDRYAELKQIIKDQYQSLGKFCKVLDMRYNTFLSKINNYNPFTEAEGERISELLHLDEIQQSKFF